MAAIERRTSAWLWLSALALGVSLTHVLIDWHIGLFGGPSMHMSTLQAGLVLLFGLVAAWWALALGLASQGQKSALVSVLVLDVGYALLANGLAVIVACPPPCEGAFPYQDISHIANMIVGPCAGYVTWKAMQASAEPVRPLLPVVTVALLVAVFAISSVSALP